MQQDELPKGSNPGYNQEKIMSFALSGPFPDLQNQVEAKWEAIPETVEAPCRHVASKDALRRVMNHEEGRCAVANCNSTGWNRMEAAQALAQAALQNLGEDRLRGVLKGRVHKDNDYRDIIYIFLIVSWMAIAYLTRISKCES